MIDSDEKGNREGERQPELSLIEPELMKEARLFPLGFRSNGL